MEKFLKIFLIFLIFFVQKKLSEGLLFGKTDKPEKPEKPDKPEKHDKPDENVTDTKGKNLFNTGKVIQKLEACTGLLLALMWT